MNVALRVLPIAALLLLSSLYPASAADERRSEEGAGALVDGPWGQIHARIAGARDQPTVVLLHRMIWSAVQFRSAQVELARRGVRSVAVDIPGFGFSAGPAAPTEIPLYAESLAPIVKALAGGRAFILAENESSAVAAAFAAKHPDMVRGLLIDGPAIYDAVARAQYATRPRVYGPPRADGGHLPAMWRNLILYTGHNLSAAAQQSMFDAVDAAGPKGWFVQDAAYAYAFVPTLQQIKVPLFFLRYRGLAHQEALASAIAARPDAAVIPIDHAGAVPSFDAPEAWGAAVGEAILKPR